MSMPSLPRDRTHKPKKHESYFSIDPRIVPALLKHVILRGVVWEPACGKKHISAAIEMSPNYTVVSTDLNSYPGSNNIILDFLKAGVPPLKDIESIVTNPPNTLNLEFTLQALELMRPVNGVVAIFQRHEWDTTQRTAPIFDHPAYHMKITLRFRPYWFEPKPGSKSPFHKFSWYVWDWKNKEKPIIMFYDNKNTSSS